MGEAAEMVLEGYLDLDGSYSGGSNIPSYLQGQEVSQALNKVNSFFKSRGYQGGCLNKDYERKGLIIAEFAQYVGSASNNYITICKIICRTDKNWKLFKLFVDENYKK